MKNFRSRARIFPTRTGGRNCSNATGKTRLEELAFLFLRAKRSVPPELQPHASLDRFAKAEEAEQEMKLVQELENWLSPPAMPLLDTPRATLRVVCKRAAGRRRAVAPSSRRAISFVASAHGRKGAHAARDSLTSSSARRTSRNLFPPHDWEFIQWIADTHRNRQRRRGHFDFVRRGIAAMARALGPHEPPRICRQRPAAAISRPHHLARAASGKWRQGTFVHAPFQSARRRKLIPSATRNFSTTSRRSRSSATHFSFCETRRRRAC